MKHQNVKVKRKNGRHTKTSKVKEMSDKHKLGKYEHDNVEVEGNMFEDEWNPTDEWGFDTELL